MSQENVDLMLTALRKVEANESIDDLIHDDAVSTAPDGWPEQGPAEGKEAVVKQFERLRADSSEHRFTDIEVVGEDQDWVVLQYKWQARGTTSGIEMSLEVAVAFRVRDQRAAEVHFRWNSDEALKAAGLSE